MLSPTRALTPAALVAGALSVIWLLTGVRISDVGLFWVYTGVFILAPGCLAYSVLDRTATGPERLAFGLGLGIALEILAFAFTAWIGARELLPAYPLVIAGGAGLLLWRRRRTRAAEAAESQPRGCEPAASPPRGWGTTVVGICGLVLALIVVASVIQNPLPGDVGDVSYFLDLVFNIGISAEALHHWPVTDPHVLGQPLPYHTFANLHMAATAQVTSIDLSTVALRFFVPSLVVLAVAQLAAAGRTLAGSWWAGPVAAALFFLVGEVDPDGAREILFANTISSSLYDSPSFLLSLVVFCPALVLAFRQLTATASVPTGQRVLLGVFVVACAGAKASLMPVLLGGMAVYAVLRMIGARRLDRTVIGTLVLTAACTGVAFALLYGGTQSGLALRYGGIVSLMPGVGWLARHLGGLGVLGTTIALIAGAIGYCGATLAGIGLLPCAPIASRHRFLAAVLAVSAVPWVFLESPSGNQNWFVFYGVLCGSLLAADGICAAVRVVGPRAAMAAGAVAAGWATVALVLVLGPLHQFGYPAGPRFAACLGLLALLLLGGCFVLARRRPLAAGLAAVFAFAAIGAFNAPLDVIPALAARERTTGVAYAHQTPQNFGMSAGLYRGLLWIRHHTPTNSVLAVNNQYLDPGRTGPGYFYFTAFAQRRVYLEGWGYAFRTTALATGRDYRAAFALAPFARRQRVNDLAFGRADARALAAMRAAGVAYLVVDTAHGGASPVLDRGLSRVYANPSIVVYRLGDPS